MDKPIVAATKPVVMELEPGTYYWCRCGRSSDQPWCDGSHKATAFTPVETVIEERRMYALCACKHTKTEPFCDGTHKQVETE